jgi:hypothetical protein
VEKTNLGVANFTAKVELAEDGRAKLAGFGLRRGAAVMVAGRDGPERLEFVLSGKPSDREADKRIRLE